VRSYKSTSFAKTRHLSAHHQRGRRETLRGRLYLDRLACRSQSALPVVDGWCGLTRPPLPEPWNRSTTSPNVQSSPVSPASASNGDVRRAFRLVTCAPESAEDATTLLRHPRRQDQMPAWPPKESRVAQTLHHHSHFDQRSH
jgi:hypothetical protein